MAQSTNDVIPTAGKLTVLDLLAPLEKALVRLEKELAKKVLGLFQRITCKLFQIWHDLIKIRIGNVDSSSHCSSSMVYGVHFPVSLFDTFPVSGNHGRITVEHLTKADRNCILKLCTSHSDRKQSR